MMSNFNEKKKHRNDSLLLFVNANDENRERLKSKLEKAKQLYNESRMKRPRPLSPKVKIPRYT